MDDELRGVGLDGHCGVAVAEDVGEVGADAEGGHGGEEGRARVLQGAAHHADAARLAWGGGWVVGYSKKDLFSNFLFPAMWDVLHIKTYLCAKWEPNWTTSSFAKIQFFFKYIGKNGTAVTFSILFLG